MFDPDFGRVADRQLRIVSGWTRRQVGTEREHQHHGVDIPLPVGTPIKAAADGVVITAHPIDNNDAGIHVAVKHAGGLVSRYLHLSRLSVSNGQRVQKGQEIGLSGNTGLSEGPHLHLDLWAPEGLLPLISATLGKQTPTGVKFSYGYAIPAEPWLPVDSYTPAVLASAIAKGLPLYSKRAIVKSSAFVSVALLGIGWLLYRWWRARPVSLSR